MKRCVPFIVSMLLCLQLSAQYTKHVIKFTDKGNNTFNLGNPSAFLSARAIERRIRFNIPFDSTDLPITKKYLDSVRLAGNVTILSTSKWLNQVLIQTTDNAALNKIRSFPFVKASNPVGFRIASADQPKREKFKEPITPLTSTTTKQQRIATDFYSYGNNYSQVHIHEGEFLHNKGYRGEKIQIAVLDAGFLQYKTITAFDTIRLKNQVLGERDFVAFDNSVNEDDSHGMYCLSIMAANWPGRMVGTAPKASYWLIRTENAPTEFPVEEHNWVTGAEFADSAGADMISSSLGYTEFDDPQFNHTYNDFYKNRTTVTQGATIAAKKGMIVMNSAGNSGEDPWKYLGFPADADSVCAVGAINAQGQIAPFSSYGYPGKIKPNIVSVGWGTIIAGLNNQPSSGSGTSFSNPNIAGLIACLWQSFPAYNNMKILDAVYKSSDRYTTPDNRFGFGIPNFRKAYLALKKEQNTTLYGSDWLFASPNPFTNEIDIRLIGQVNGSAKLELFSPSNQLIATKVLTTQLEEVYTDTFFNLNLLQPGQYNLRYSDSANSKSIVLKKEVLLTNSWISASPNPFSNSLTVTIKAPETGKAGVRLMDEKGSKVEEISLNVTEGQIQIVSFKNIPKFQRGTYFLQYISSNNKKTIRLLKQ